MFLDGGLQVDEELVREQLARNIAFLGEEGVEKLRKSFVIIVGAGKDSLTVTMFCRERQIMG